MTMNNKMRISCIQLDMKLGDVEYNYAEALRLIRETVEKEKSDVVVLPETWTTGFYPKENLADYCERDGERVKKTFSALAKELNVNIVAGSIANEKNGGIYNTAFVFNREGEVVAEYDKTHLFTPMDEHRFFSLTDISAELLSATISDSASLSEALRSRASTCSLWCPNGRWSEPLILLRSQGRERLKIRCLLSAAIPAAKLRTLYSEVIRR